jgi:hypothetical protein
MGKKSKHSSGRARFPEYLEERHHQYIDRVKEDVERVKVLSPYSEYTDIDVDTAFFGAGYVLSSFPSLYDMYGKFMAGLDIEYLFNQAFIDTTDGAIVHNLVSEQASILSDDLVNEIIPRYEVGMRDINAVVSGTFVVGKAMLERKRTQELSRFDSEIRYKMIPVSVERWKTHLEWNKQVVSTYAEIVKFYFMAVLDVDGYNYEMHAKDLLWPFTVYDFERLALSAVGSPGGGTGIGTAGASRGAKVIGGAMSGAAAGAMVGSAVPGVGTAVGAGVGGVLGLASGFF